MAAELRVEVDCPRCGKPLAWRPSEQHGALSCGGDCGGSVTPAPTAGAATGGLDRCLHCGERRLYRQRDFHRHVGLAVVLGGALASLALLPFSALAAYGVLFALAGIDLVLYLRLPEVAICYRCKARHRGFGRDVRIEPFDLLTAEMVDDQERRRGTTAPPE